MTEQNTIKVALVTGASRGIGASIALELAKNNIFVIGTATSDKGVKVIEENFKINQEKGIGLVLNVNENKSIDDLIKQNADIKVAKKGNRIIGFSIQTNSTEESKSQLILAGCSLGDEIFVKSLWNEILLYNKSLGFSRIETMISGSNIGVMNVYNYFNFTTQKTLFGFHKFINK